MLVLLFSNNIDSRFTPAGPNLIFGQKNWELFWRVSLLSGCRKLQKVLKNLLLTKERKNLSPFQNMKILYFFGCCENVEQAIILAKKSFLCISFLKWFSSRTDLGKDKLVTKIASPNFYTIHLLKKSLQFWSKLNSAFAVHPVGLTPKYELWQSVVYRSLLLPMNYSRLSPINQW